MKYLELFDTLSGRLRPVVPADGKTLGFYCCGPTVYGPAHIGNFRSFLAQDIFRRVVELCGIPVHHVRNITDVEDKTIRQSQAEGKSLKAFTEYWSERFHVDSEGLGLLPPHQEPEAVAHIPHQIVLIKQLIEKDYAYVTEDGSVYFRISSFAGYGRLSRLDQREIVAGQGGSATDADEYDKDNVTDFVLWKARKPEDGENFWDSPWGEGRPGWHIECSAMSREYLGDTFDLHSGGIDLCFPHHENEIAQSECATGEPFAHHWFHITHLMVENQKMSKSLGNLYTLEDVVAKGYSAMELRYVLASGHYRKPLNFTFDSLGAARQALQRLADAAAELSARAGGESPPSYEELTATAAAFRVVGSFSNAWDALLNNLNVPKALGGLFTGLKKIGGLNAEQAAVAHRELHILLAALGLTLPAVSPVADAPPEVVALAEERWDARSAKDWALADDLRERISAAGWTVKDGKDTYELVSR